MKILQINAVGQTRSTGRTCKELQDFVNAQTPHECRTAFAQGQVDAHSVQIGNPVEWKMHGLWSRLTGKQAFFSRCGTRKLLRYMEEYAPDVVILRNLHGNYVNLPMLLQYLAQKDIATIAVLHDCWFYTGRCTHYTATGCFRWQTRCHNCPRLKLDNPSWFFDPSQSLWKIKKRLFEAIPRLAVVGVSDWITSEAEKSYLACAKKITRIYNWIDLEVFSPQDDLGELREKYQLPGKKVVLGVASGWSEAKGLSKFPELAQRLGKAYQVVLIGKMPDGFALPANVTNVPATDSAAELAKWYNLADVFFTASIEESFGKVSAEALACGTPIVCLNSTANKELVGAGCGVCLSADSDMEAIEQAIREVCAKDAVEYRENCRKFARENFDMQPRIKDYLTVAEFLLELSNKNKVMAANDDIQVP